VLTLRRWIMKAAQPEIEELKTSNSGAEQLEILGQNNLNHWGKTTCVERGQQLELLE
jgi:hypothetical protein